MNVREETMSGTRLAFLYDELEPGVPARVADLGCGTGAVHRSTPSAAPVDRGKQRLIAEAYRLLKPGGRLVIADCFMTNTRPLHRLMHAVYRRWCASWAVPELPHVEAVREAMTSAGFADIEFTGSIARLSATTWSRRVNPPADTFSAAPGGRNRSLTPIQASAVGRGSDLTMRSLPVKAR